MARSNRGVPAGQKRDWTFFQQLFLPEGHLMVVGRRVRPGRGLGGLAVPRRPSSGAAQLRGETAAGFRSNGRVPRGGNGGAGGGGKRRGGGGVHAPDATDVGHAAS